MHKSENLAKGIYDYSQYGLVSIFPLEIMVKSWQPIKIWAAYNDTKAQRYKKRWTLWTREHAIFPPPWGINGDFILLILCASYLL